MKRKILLFMSIFLIISLIFVSIALNKCMNGEKVQEDSGAIYSIIDFPLIDIYFDKNDEWIVIDRKNLFTSEESYYICTNSDVIEKHKEALQIVTFPVGRGTTPNGELYVYKNGELFKEISYLGITYNDENLKKGFIPVTESDILDKIATPLPSPI